MRTMCAGLTALSLAGGAAVLSAPAAAQQQDEAQAKQQEQPQTDMQGRQQTQAQEQNAAQGQQDDALIATVGGDEVRRSDVMEAIEALPPRVQQTPMQMLIPAVVDQLVVRRLIVERARAENLQQDPSVQELVNAHSSAREEDAMVQVWVQREMDERVTDEAVEGAFAELKASNPAMDQTLEQARPQIEQALQQQAVADLSAELREGADITYYGPGGEPLDMESQGGSSESQ